MLNIARWYYVKNLNEAEQFALEELLREYGFTFTAGKKPTDAVYVNFGIYQCDYTDLRADQYDGITMENVIATLKDMGKQVEVKLNSAYTANVSFNKIKIGCQTFTHDEMRRIISEMNVALDSFKTVA